MELTQYSNGPLPDFLQRQAYLNTETGEFGLNAMDAMLYLDWCKDSNLRILGFETWQPTIPGPTVILGAVWEGDAESCRTGIDKFGVEHGDGVVFSIWVDSV
jgi:hypothetical protein